MRRVAGPGAAPPMLDDTGDLGLSEEESRRIDRARGRFGLPVHVAPPCCCAVHVSPIPSSVQRVHVAPRGRFRLHRMLDAANVGAATLDRVLIKMREDLEPSFFDHLQWEIEQQVGT